MPTRPFELRRTMGANEDNGEAPSRVLPRRTVVGAEEGRLADCNRRRDIADCFRDAAAQNSDREKEERRCQRAIPFGVSLLNIFCDLPNVERF